GDDPPGIVALEGRETTTVLAAADGEPGLDEAHRSGHRVGAVGRALHVDGQFSETVGDRAHAPRSVRKAVVETGAAGLPLAAVEGRLRVDPVRGHEAETALGRTEGVFQNEEARVLHIIELARVEFDPRLVDEGGSLAEEKIGEGASRRRGSKQSDQGRRANRGGRECTLHLVLPSRSSSERPTNRWRRRAGQCEIDGCGAKYRFLTADRPVREEATRRLLRSSFTPAKGSEAGVAPGRSPAQWIIPGRAGSPMMPVPVMG